MNLAERILAALPDLIDIRHDLHQHPEVAYTEVRTSQVVVRELEKIGLKPRSGLAGGTGVVATLPATGPVNKRIGLRADMDALPVLEDTGLRYASCNAGQMHACGHDGHTTMLLGAAKVLSQIENRPNDVTFVFQPAEERGAGADRMVADGAVKGLDLMFGQHGWPSGELGVMMTRVGALMASADVFRIRIEGRGGHAAFPHITIDPIVAAAQVIVALQTIVSRNVDPLDAAVVTVTKVEAGTTTNVIPDVANVIGTLRTLNDHYRDLCKARIEQVAKSICEGLGASCSVVFDDPYPVTVNHADAVSWFRSAVPQASSLEAVPVMGAEDFSYYGPHVPSCFFFLGLNEHPETAYPGLHTPKFDFNDEALPFGIEAFCRLALHG